MNNTKYKCELTDGLNKVAQLEGKWTHYIIEDSTNNQCTIYAIRVPGGTVGNVKVDANNMIVSIFVDTTYVVKTYNQKELDELIETFLGKQIKVEVL